MEDDQAAGGQNSSAGRDRVEHQLRGASGGDRPRAADGRERLRFRNVCRFRACLPGVCVDEMPRVSGRGEDRLGKTVGQGGIVVFVWNDSDGYVKNRGAIAGRGSGAQSWIDDRSWASELWRRGF